MTAGNKTDWLINVHWRVLLLKTFNWKETVFLTSEYTARLRRASFSFLY
jgi:hypothetical protein